jgi:outer membrane biosynthesis protein TonB
MSLQKAVANALSFAHLGGIGRGKASKAAAEDDEEKKDAKAEAEDDDEKKDDKSAEGEDDDASAEGDDPEKKDDDEKPSSKAESDDDEDKDEEMRGKSAVAQARRREQGRCAAIFASPAAARNPVLAANLAFMGRMPRREAIAMLEGTPAPAAASHVSRSARNPQVGAGGEVKTTPQQAAAARWDQNLQAAAKAGRR